MSGALKILRQRATAHIVGYFASQTRKNHSNLYT
jgi:hypothetical protein